MGTKSIFLSVGLISLSLSYLLFNNQQYFSMPSMVALFVLALLAAIFFIFAQTLAVNKNKRLLLAGSMLLIAAIAFYELSFSHVTFQDLSFAIGVAMVVFAASLVSAVGVYLTAIAMKSAKGKMLFIIPVMCLAFTSVFAYLIMYGFSTPNWNGVDELAYNYYAADLFNHGMNPYTTSMEPILTQRHISPTVELDGVYEYAYDYPPLSFLAFLMIPLLGITSFFSFIFIVVMLSIFASFIIYQRSGHQRMLLLPIGIWLFFTFTLVGTSSHYLAIAVFVLLGFLERKRAILSGVLLGLGAATIQLAWFFIPFLFVLELREFGREHFLKQAGAALLTFLAVCAYFVLLSPQQTIGNIFALFGLNKLPFYGINIMQFSYAFYPVAYWYSAFVSIAAFALMLALFYFYTKSLLPMLAVVPAMIFFLSWRNITLYSLPAIPLLLAVYYSENRASDLSKEKRHALYAVIGFSVFALAVAICSNSSYLQQQTLTINRIMPVLYLQNSFNGAYFSLGSLFINVSGTGPTPQNVSFYMVSRSPNFEAYALGSLLPKLSPNSSYNYTIDFQLPMVNNSTKIFVFAFSKDSIVSKELDLAAIAPPSSFVNPG
jgi:uncharacterized membrane protein